VWLINGEVGDKVLADYFSPVNPLSVNKQNLQPREMLNIDGKGEVGLLSGPLLAFLAREEGVESPL